MAEVGEALRQLQRFHHFFAVLLLTALSSFFIVSAAQAAQGICPVILKNDHQNFLSELRAFNFKSGAASGSGKAAQRLTQWLKQRHNEVVRHEEAHKKAAGKWGGKIEYLYYTWWNIPYATAGCHQAKRGIPLEVALKTALAPEQPSKWDLKNAKKLEQIIKRRKSR